MIKGLFRFIGNVLWFLITGLETGLLYIVLGILWCCTLIGIPFGVQCFKFAGLAFWPFGRKVEGKIIKKPIINLLWFILGGFIIFLLYLLFGVLWCITIIGIPFGKQCFKLARLALHPFGSTAYAQ